MDKEELKNNVASVLKKHDLSIEELEKIAGGRVSPCWNPKSNPIDELINGRWYDWLSRLIMNKLQPPAPRTRAVNNKQDPNDIDI